MSRNALIIRTEAGLAEAAAELARVAAQLEDGAYKVGDARERRLAQEARNLVDTGLMMVAAARLRKETRGSHYRQDAPAPDPAWDRSIRIDRASDARRTRCGTWRTGLACGENGGI